MKPTDQIRFHMGEIENLCKQIDGVQVDDKPPEVPGDPPKPSGQTINGHSLHADDEGFASVPEFETVFQQRVSEAKLSPNNANALRAKLYWGIVNESVVLNCIFPTPEARLKARQNLIRRNSTIMVALGGDNFTHDALLVGVTKRPPPATTDYNADQEATPNGYYEFKDLAVLGSESGHARYAGNWDPKYSAAYFVKLFDDRITAELGPRNPIDTPPT